MSVNRVDRFLKLAADRGASDLHLSVGRPPHLRLSGSMDPVRFRVLNRDDFVTLMKPATPEAHWTRFVKSGDADFAYEVTGLARFRVNLFHQQRGMGAVFRLIPSEITTFDQLELPESMRRIAELDSGLVLVTGPTGSGKSTTLAALVHEMNLRRAMHIITIEDPIEFVHRSQRALISQREVGKHSGSFASALRVALREDPDAVLVGELRDLETMRMALEAAETGLLVLATLHTNSAAKSIDRVVGVFPSDEQPGIRGIVANVLQAVVAQQLLPRTDGGRAAAFEILFAGPEIATPIREGKVHLVNDFITLHQKEGMVSMDESIRRLIERDLVSAQAALEKSSEKEGMKSWLERRGAQL